MGSGCSRHMIEDKALFNELKPFNEGTVDFGNNEKGKISSKGNIFQFSKAYIEEVLFVEGLKHNLMSISQLCDKGYKVVFESTMCNVLNGDQLIFSGKRHGNIYLVSLDDLNEKCLLAIENNP